MPLIVFRFEDNQYKIYRAQWHALVLFLLTTTFHSGPLFWLLVFLRYKVAGSLFIHGDKSTLKLISIEISSTRYFCCSYWEQAGHLPCTKFSYNLNTKLFFFIWKFDYILDRGYVHANCFKNEFALIYRGPVLKTRIFHLPNPYICISFILYIFICIVY